LTYSKESKFDGGKIFDGLKNSTLLNIVVEFWALKVMSFNES